MRHVTDTTFDRIQSLCNMYTMVLERAPNSSVAVELEKTLLGQLRWLNGNVGDVQ